MPHLTLEYTANINEAVNFADLFQQCHQVLVAGLPTQLASCKSRAVVREHYYVGDGDPQNAFVTLTVKVMPGRKPEILDKVAQELLAIVQQHFILATAQLNLQITVEVAELSPHYKKYIPIK